MPRQTYSVTFPDGHRQTFDGPPGMSDADLIQRAQQERKFAGGDIATTFTGGATRHLLENEPATVSTLLNTGALATGLGAPAIAAVPAVTSGLKRLSQFLATGRADPIGLGEVATDVAEGAAMGYGGEAIGAGARAIGRVKPALQAATGRAAATVAEKLGIPQRVLDMATPVAKWGARLTNPKLLALDVATSKPVLGAVEGLGEALSPEGVSDAFGSVARGMRPGVAPPEEPSLVDLANRWRTKRATVADFEAASRPPADLSGLKATATGAPPAPAAGGPAWDAFTALPETPATGLEATGTGSQAAGHLAGRDYPSWLRQQLGSGASDAAAETAVPAGLAPTGTGAPAAPVTGAGPELADWLQQMRARMLSAAEPAEAGATGLEATGTSAPSAAPTSGPTWDAFSALKRAAGVPEAPPPAGLAATATGAPGTAPASGPTWDQFTTLTRPASPAPAAAMGATAAAPEEAASLAALRRAGAVTEQAGEPTAAAAATPTPRGRTQAQFAQFSPEARAARAAAQAPTAAVSDAAPAAIPEFDVPPGPTTGTAAPDVAPDDAATLEALMNLPAFRALLRKIE